METVTGNAAGAHTGTFDGDMTGTMSGDDSTILVDGINNKIVGAVETLSLRTTECNYCTWISSRSNRSRK